MCTYGLRKQKAHLYDLSGEPTVWKSRKLQLLKSVANVLECFLWAIWLQHLIKTNPITMHHPKLRRNNSCVQHCGTVHNFTSNSSVPCAYSLVGAGGCMRQCVACQDVFEGAVQLSVRTTYRTNNAAILSCQQHLSIHLGWCIVWRFVLTWGCSHTASYEKDVT